MGRKRYMAVRTLQTVFILWFVMTFLFFFFRLLPGNYSDLMLFSGASEEAVAAFRARWGLDDPLYVQYIRYLVNFVQLDMGTSLQFKIPVIDYVKLKIFNTLILVGPAITIGYILGSALGTVFGYLRDTKLEQYGVLSLITLGAFPEFFLGIVFILIFASWLNLVPTSGMISSSVTLQYQDAAWWRPYLTTDFATHYILPFGVIVLRFLYTPTMVMRTSVVEVMGQDFVYYHKITGLPYAARLSHLAKHAVLPVITLYPVSMTRAISGLVLLEVVFNWPGIGFALVNAVLARDYPVVQFVFFMTAFFVIISNFVVDIVYGIIDPRITVGES